MYLARLKKNRKEKKISCLCASVSIHVCSWEHWSGRLTVVGSVSPRVRHGQSVDLWASRADNRAAEPVSSTWQLRTLYSTPPATTTRARATSPPCPSGCCRPHDVGRSLDAPQRCNTVDQWHSCRRAAAGKQSLKYSASTRRAYFHITAVTPWRSCTRPRAERVSPWIPDSPLAMTSWGITMETRNGALYRLLVRRVYKWGELCKFEFLP